MTEVTLKVLPEIETRVVELSQKLEAIMVERAPEAWEATLGVVQLDAIQDLVYGGVALIVLIAIMLASFFVSKSIKSVLDDGDEGAEYIPIIGGVIISLIPFLIFITKVSNSWTWAALFSPELVIAKRVLEGII